MPKTKLKFKKQSKTSQFANRLFEDLDGVKEAKPLDLKERLAQKRQARDVRRKIFSVLGISFVFAILVALPLGIAVNPRVGGSVAIGFPVLLLCFNYPRTALWVFLIYMPFNGTITYWIGQGNALFQLSKDAFYLPALLGLVLECRRRKLPILIPKKLLPSLGILIFCALLTLLFANGWQQTLPLCSQVPEAERFLRDGAGNLLLDANGIIIRRPCTDGGMPVLQGILGLKVLLGYIPLIFCTHYLIQDKKRLLLLGRILVIIALVCCSLALVQYWMLKTGRCVGTREMAGVDLFKPNLDAKCLVGGAVLYSPEQGQIRLPGTFVSPWHWAWFLVANAAICFATSFSDTSLFWRTTGLVGMGMVFVNAVICGQRLALALVPAVIIVLLILTGQIANLKRFIPIGLGLSLVLFVAFSFINPDFVQQRIDSFVNRWNQAPPYAFIQTQFEFALEQQKGFLGRGVGKATNSTRVFGSVSLVETFHPKLLFEMGFPGLIAFMAFITHLTILCFKSYRSVKDRALRSFGSSLWVFMLIIGYFPYWYPLDTDPVAVYYWLFAGVVLKLSDIDKQEQEKLKASQGNSKNKRSPLKKKKFVVASS